MCCLHGAEITHILTTHGCHNSQISSTNAAQSSYIFYPSFSAKNSWMQVPTWGIWLMPQTSNVAMLKFIVALLHLVSSFTVKVSHDHCPELNCIRPKGPCRKPLSSLLMPPPWRCLPPQRLQEIAPISSKVRVICLTHLSMIMSRVICVLSRSQALAIFTFVK